jgi:hypothetical protein
MAGFSLTLPTKLAWRTCLTMSSKLVTERSMSLVLLQTDLKSLGFHEKK